MFEGAVRAGLSTVRSSRLQPLVGVAISKFLQRSEPLAPPVPSLACR